MGQRCLSSYTDDVLCVRALAVAVAVAVCSFANRGSSSSSSNTAGEEADEQSVKKRCCCQCVSRACELQKLVAMRSA